MKRLVPEVLTKIGHLHDGWRVNFVALGKPLWSMGLIGTVRNVDAARLTALLG